MNDAVRDIHTVILTLTRVFHELKRCIPPFTWPSHDPHVTLSDDLHVTLSDDLHMTLSDDLHMPCSNNPQTIWNTSTVTVILCARHTLYRSSSHRFTGNDTFWAKLDLGISNFNGDDLPNAPYPGLKVSSQALRNTLASRVRLKGWDTSLIPEITHFPTI